MHRGLTTEITMINSLGSRARRTGLVVVVLLVGVATFIGSFAVLTTYWRETCAPVWWSDQLGEQLVLVAEQSGVSQTEWSVSNCDSGDDYVDVTFELGIDRTEAMRLVAAAAEQQGWQLIDGEPWWGCRTKRIYGMPAQMKPESNLEPGTYNLKGSTSLGGFCNGGKWPEDNPTN